MNKNTRVLVTGIQGFVGKHFYRYLLAQGDAEIFGIDRIPDALGMGEGFYFRADLAAALVQEETIIDRIRPDVIFHLAGLTHGDRPVDFYDYNFLCGYHLCERLYRLRSGEYDPLLVVLGTAAEYGAGARTGNTESDHLLPISHYGVSKALQTLMTQLFDRLRRLRVIIGRPSNITGPGQSHTYIIPDLAREIAKMEMHAAEPVLTIRNGSVVRDFVDIRDMVRALALLAESGRAGEVYNISSNSPVSVRMIAEELRGLARVPVSIREENVPVNPDSIPVQTSDNTKIRTDTGWSPRITLRQSIEDILNEQRESAEARAKE